MDHQRRQNNAATTSNLIRVLQALEGTDFTNKMGSGIIMGLDGITEGQRSIGEFLLAAEDMEVIKGPIIHSIRNFLHLRKVALSIEIRDIEAALKK